MLDKLRTKIKSLIEDFSTSGFQIFEYTTSDIFTIAQSNITITNVLINGNDLASGESYAYDSTTGKITITRSSWTSGDKAEVDYTFYNYSDTELNEFIRASLVHISIHGTEEEDYELETSGIYPTPNNRTLDLVAIISSILIKPNFIKKKLPNLEVVYPTKLTKTEQIKEIIQGTDYGIGLWDVINW